MPKKEVFVNYKEKKLSRKEHMCDSLMHSVTFMGSYQVTHWSQTEFTSIFLTKSDILQWCFQC